MNQWNGVGHVGQDPHLRETGSGKAVLNMSIAIDRQYSEIDGSGNRTKHKTVDWIPLTMWGDMARLNARYLRQGSQIAVTGACRPRTYTDRHGEQHNTFEINVTRVDWISNIRTDQEIEEQARPTARQQEAARQ